MPFHYFYFTVISFHPYYSVIAIIAYVLKFWTYFPIPLIAQEQLENNGKKWKVVGDTFAQ